MDKDVDGNSTHWAKRGQTPHRIRGREPAIIKYMFEAYFFRFETAEKPLKLLELLSELFKYQGSILIFCSHLLHLG